MLSKFLGISAGMALGAAMFAAPASAATVGWTDAGGLDIFEKSCTWVNSASEVDCFADLGVTVTGADIGNAGDPPTFLTVLDNGLDVNSEVFPGGDIFAVLLDGSLSGGWFSIKTGALGSDKVQKIFIFENLANMMYATLDLTDFFLEGYDLKDIDKISHMTAVGVVPLPGAALLFGSALLGGGLMRRRKVIKKLGLPS